jgi:CHAT domain-containing protein
MERFYQNHWEKQMSVLKALREAQLWMLREGRARGFQRLDAPAAAQAQNKKLPPYYWAAFVLSGDWQ